MQISEDTFPTTDPRPIDTKAPLYSVLVDTRASDESYHHHLRIPVRCAIQMVPAVAPTRDHPMTTLALHRSTKGPPLTVRVSASRLGREVAPADWLEDLLSTLGHEVLESRRLPGRAGEQVDTLTRDSDGLMVRSRAIKSGGLGGGRLLIAQALAPAESYADTALDAYHATISLDWEHPGHFPFAENLTTYSRPAPGDFLIYYPASWKRREQPPTPEDPGVLLTELLHVGRSGPVGRIGFMCARGGHSEASLLGRFLKGLLVDAYVPALGPPVEIEPFGGLEGCAVRRGHAHRRAAPDGSPAPKIEIPRDLRSDSAISVEPEFDLQIQTGRRGPVAYLVGLTSVRREDASGAAAINRRAFQIVCGLMQTEVAG